MCRGLQPYVPGAATLFAGVCNPTCRGRQPYVPGAATLRAGGCNPMCARLQAEMAAEAARVAAAYVHTEMRTAGGYVGGGQKPALARPTMVAQVRARVRVRVLGLGLGLGF